MTGKMKVFSYLHSILVKSIQVLFDFLFGVYVIYIPFWLNLYDIAFKCSVNVKDLHSILVKSIQIFKLMYMRNFEIFTFHSG